jgi:hypothetical protein
MPWLLDPQQDALVTLNIRLGGPQNHYGYFGDKKNLLAPQRFKPLIIQSQAVTVPHTVLYLLQSYERAGN